MFFAAVGFCCRGLSLPWVSLPLVVAAAGFLLSADKRNKSS
jgi:hypothetical protein